MSKKIPVKEKSYKVDSVQRRLCEIVYEDSQPETMVSRQGKHLEAFRDKVQMLGGIEAPKTFEERALMIEPEFGGYNDLSDDAKKNFKLLGTDV